MPGYPQVGVRKGRFYWGVIGGYPELQNTLFRPLCGEVSVFYGNVDPEKKSLR